MRALDFFGAIIPHDATYQRFFKEKEILFRFFWCSDVLGNKNPFHSPKGDLIDFFGPVELLRVFSKFVEKTYGVLPPSFS